MTRVKSTYAGLLVIVIMLAGCVTTERYNIVLNNVGKEEITDAHVKYGEFCSVGGIITPGSKKSHGRPEYPIPKIAVVEWRTQNGALHSRQVEVKKHVPKRFRGDIEFTINTAGDVTVKCLPGGR